MYIVYIMRLVFPAGVLIGSAQTGVEHQLIPVCAPAGREVYAQTIRHWRVIATLARTSS